MIFVEFISSILIRFVDGFQQGQGGWFELLVQLVADIASLLRVVDGRSPVRVWKKFESRPFVTVNLESLHSHTIYKEDSKYFMYVNIYLQVPL